MAISWAGTRKTLFDLGSSYSLDRVDIWYVVANAGGVRAPASVTYTVDAGTPVLVTGFPTTDGAHQFSLYPTGQNAQTVELDFVNGGDWWAVNEIQFLAPPPWQEMNVTGNGESIADGDTKPSGAITPTSALSPVSGRGLTRTFTIQNRGTSSPLSLTGTPTVVISGADAADFSVTLDPTNSMAAGTSTTFQVTFRPSAVGARTATVSIANDDADEDPYDFAIQGFGTTSLAIHSRTRTSRLTPALPVPATRPWARRICSTTGSTRRRPTSPPVVTGGPLST